MRPDGTYTAASHWTLGPAQVLRPAMRKVWFAKDGGRCPAGAAVTEGVRHGHPSVLTGASRTSRLPQGPSAHSARLGTVRFDGPVAQDTVFGPPVADCPRNVPATGPT